MRTTIATVLVVLATASTAAAASPPPPGANLPCQPSAAHPEPVILVHGTFENMFDNWQAMAPALRAAGYCVYAFDYGSYDGSGLIGIYGVGRIEASAQQLSSEVDTVLAQTGASKVDLVGHSRAA
jgi:triacylglycerol esterase/lipase EstA (alpha/beta hydrolase family)